MYVIYIPKSIPRRGRRIFEQYFVGVVDGVGKTNKQKVVVEFWNGCI